MTERRTSSTSPGATSSVTAQFRSPKGNVIAVDVVGNLSSKYLWNFLALTLSPLIELVCDVLICKLAHSRSLEKNQFAVRYLNSECVIRFWKHMATTRSAVWGHNLQTREITYITLSSVQQRVFLSLLSVLLTATGSPLKTTSSVFDIFTAFLKSMVMPANETRVRTGRRMPLDTNFSLP